MRVRLPTAVHSRLAVLLLCAALAGCSDSVDLHTGLSERDANEVTAALLDNGIQGQKEAANKQGFVVKVRKKDLAASVALLREHGLPRNAFSRMGEIFKKDGMISTPVEERARYLYALSQELENTLSQIDGVVLARVHPVLPERIVPGEPVQPSSCAVLIKHRPDWDAEAYEARIRSLVLASIPGLADLPQKISIVFVAATMSEDVQARAPGVSLRPSASVTKADASAVWMSLPMAAVSLLALCAVVAAGWLAYRDFARRSGRARTHANP